MDPLFEATLRVVSYPEAVALAGRIPIVGPLFGPYAYYLQVVGIREMHRTTTGTALGIVLLLVSLTKPLSG